MPTMTLSTTRPSRKGVNGYVRSSASFAIASDAILRSDRLIGMRPMPSNSVTALSSKSAISNRAKNSKRCPSFRRDRFADALDAPWRWTPSIRASTLDRDDRNIERLAYGRPMRATKRFRRSPRSILRTATRSLSRMIVAPAPPERFRVPLRGWPRSPRSYQFYFRRRRPVKSARLVDPRPFADAETRIKSRLISICNRG